MLLQHGHDYRVFPDCVIIRLCDYMQVWVTRPNHSNASWTWSKRESPWAKSFGLLFTECFIHIYSIGVVSRELHTKCLKIRNLLKRETVKEIIQWRERRVICSCLFSVTSLCLTLSRLSPYRNDVWMRNGYSSVFNDEVQPISNVLCCVSMSWISKVMFYIRLWGTVTRWDTDQWDLNIPLGVLYR